MGTGGDLHVMRLIHSRTADIEETTRVVGLLGFDITEEGLPGLIGKADGVPGPPPIGPGIAHEVQVAADPCAIDSGERTQVVGLLGFDVAEEGLPGQIGKADGVPELPIFLVTAHDVQVVANSRAADIVEKPGVVGLLGFDVAEEGLPGLIGKADGVPELSILGHAHDVQVATDPRAIDSAERTRVVRLLGFDIAEEGLPGLIGKADGVPELRIVEGNADDVQVATDSRATDSPKLSAAGVVDQERTGIVRLLSFDIAEEGLPGLVGKADGVPQVPVFGHAHDVQVATDPRAIDSVERTRVVGLLGFDIAEEGLPGLIGKADGVPELPIGPGIAHDV